MNLPKPSQIETAVRELAEPIAARESLILWDVRFEKEGASYYLRIYIDKNGDGISLDDCEAVNREINPLLDKQDFIDKIDIVSVGSPGLERPLRTEKHFLASIGKPVTIKLYKAADGLKEHKGILKSYENQTFTITAEGVEKAFSLPDVAKINLNDLED